ncbi:MAG: PA14 domain-containing protein [Bdellovibrionota bacterium]
MKQLLSVALFGFLAFGCKTAHFKGETATVRPVTPPGSTSVLENPIIPTNGTSTSETKPDGSVVTTTKIPDGTVAVSTKGPDGSVTTVVTKPNGEVTTVANKPDGTGTKEIKNPDGTKTTTTVIKRPDGTVSTETKYPDKSVVVEDKKPDGTTVITTTKPDGTVVVETKKPDGSVITETKTPDGKTTVVDTSTKPDGTVTTNTKGPDGTKTTTTVIRRPDGTSTTDTKTTAPDGKVTTENKTVAPDGKVTTVVTAPDGKKTVTEQVPNPDGTSKTTVTKPDGTKTTTNSSDPLTPGKGKPVTPGADGKTPPVFVECPENPDYMLVAALYQIPANSPNIPDFKTIQKIKEVCLRQLDVTNRIYTEGFPGVRNLLEGFALNIKWRVFIPENGRYAFALNSDDGSLLYVDNKLIIKNDGLHPQARVEEETELSRGWHNFNVAWYQGPKFHIALELMWKRPNTTQMEYIPVNYFARP